MRFYAKQLLARHQLDPVRTAYSSRSRWAFVLAGLWCGVFANAQQNVFADDGRLEKLQVLLQATHVVKNCLHLDEFTIAHDEPLEEELRAIKGDGFDASPALCKLRSRFDIGKPVLLNVGNRLADMFLTPKCEDSVLSNTNPQTYYVFKGQNPDIVCLKLPAN